MEYSIKQIIIKILKKNNNCSTYYHFNRFNRCLLNSIYFQGIYNSINTELLSKKQLYKLDLIKSFFEKKCLNKKIKIIQINDLQKLQKFLFENGIIWKSGKDLYELDPKIYILPKDDIKTLTLKIDSFGQLTFSMIDWDIESDFEKICEKDFYSYYEKTKREVNYKFNKFIKENYNIWK